MDDNRIGYVNENDVIPFDDVHRVMSVKMEPLLKMEYSCICEGEYYMSWDGDTVPCKEVKIFKDDGKPYLDIKHEYNELYFTTMGKLIQELKKFI